MCGGHLPIRRRGVDLCGLRRRDSVKCGGRDRIDRVRDVCGRVVLVGVVERVLELRLGDVPVVKRRDRLLSVLGGPLQRGRGVERVHALRRGLFHGQRWSDVVLELRCRSVPKSRGGDGVRGMRRRNFFGVDRRDRVGYMRELLGRQLHGGDGRERVRELRLGHVPVRGWCDELHFLRQRQHLAVGVGIVLELRGRAVQLRGVLLHMRRRVVLNSRRDGVHELLGGRLPDAGGRVELF